MKHTWYECTKPCDNPYCPYCEGGLGTCTVCGASEGELTTDCVGRKLTRKEKEDIYIRGVDFKNNKWINTNKNTEPCCVCDKHTHLNKPTGTAVIVDYGGLVCKNACLIEYYIHTTNRLRRERDKALERAEKAEKEIINSY